MTTGDGAFNMEDIDAFEIVDSKTINVLFVGRSGCGKTTLIKMLRDKNYQVESTTGYSDTRDPACYRCILHNKVAKRVYQLNILDTPGLKEHRINPEENRDDNTLLNLALRCIEQNVTFLNAVCFVTKAGDTYEHDLAIFRKLTNFLGEKFKPITMLILTHTEQLTENRIQTYMTDLRTHPLAKAATEYCGLGILASGVINSEHYEEFPEDVRNIVIANRQNKITLMRNKLMQTLIPLADRPVKNEHMDEFVRKIREETHAVGQRAVQQYKNKNDCPIL